MKFSERMGITKAKSVIQREGMDEVLKNQLWNLITIHFWDPYKMVINLIWDSYFKTPIDTIPNSPNAVYHELRNYIFSCKWYEVYNFLEFLVQHRLIRNVAEFKKLCNSVQELELSAYRFVGDNIAEITSGEEIGAIEKALKDTSAIGPAREHLECALGLFSNKKSPDYRNTIKESISAVESICKLVTKNEKTTLGQALKLLEDKGIPLHPALRGAFEKLYGYTNDTEGIRHGLTDESTIDSEDAKFMLVACSAFVSYLVIKSQKAGINFEKSN